MLKYETLLIDADNTILDFSGGEKLAFAKVMEYANLENTPKLHQTYHKINRNLWDALERGEIERDLILSGERYKQLFSYLNIDKDGEEAEKIFLNELCKCDLTVENAVEVIGKLAVNYKLYCVTNGFYISLISRLTNTGLIKYFDDVFVSENIGYEKPNPCYFDYVFRKIGEDKKANTMIIGDSLHADMKGGIDSNITTCWYNPLRKEKDLDLNIDYEINDLKELYDILGD